MTHAESVHRAILQAATDLPGFHNLRPEVQQSLIELADQYFHDEFQPRLHGMINIPRYEIAIHEKTEEDRLFIEEQMEFLSECVVKAQRAAHEQLLETYDRMMSRRRAAR